jgi:hypothetical protein
VLVAGALAAGCGGGGSSSPTSSTPPASGGGGASKLVVLESGSFESLVLQAPRPSLVEFLSPT